MTTFLADGNLLIALAVVDHVHHEAALTWFEGDQPDLATCPITQGTLIRFLVREGRTGLEAAALLDIIRGQPWHQFWTDAIGYEADLLTAVLGHRQVTDAYLVALARHYGGRLATLDRGLEMLHGADAAFLIPT